MFYRTLDTPVGTLLLVATVVGVVRVAYANEHHDLVLDRLTELTGAGLSHAPARLGQAAEELSQYFDRRRRHFDFPLDLSLARGFRRNILGLLREIPYGTTASYSSVAIRAGNPGASRAVGSACAANPLPIAIPCHRVVRSDGTLGEYAGGGDVKKILLDLETTP